MQRHPFYWLATLALLVAIFKVAQEVLVPLALAVVIAFALQPGVRALERPAGRLLAVAVVIGCALGAVGAFAYMLRWQVGDLSGQMTRYSSSMRKKLLVLRGQSDPAGLSGITRTLDDVFKDLDTKVAENREARPVRLVPAEASAIDRLSAIVTPALEPAAKTLIVIVLVIFLLSQREALRDRLIRLLGRGNVGMTTRTLDEAGHRISRYLLVQSTINAGFGLAVTLGLLAIGVPYAALFGVVTAVLRFIPFVGAALAMLLPTMLAFAIFPGWTQLLLVVALFVALDVITAYFVEPVAIGRRTGVSALALVIAAVFWAWLWGPVGLLLTTPLTVCLVVVGKHVPRLEILAVLLGDEPALEPRYTFYQRLLAGDEDEAEGILEKSLRTAGRVEAFDAVVLPALLLAARDHARGDLSDGDHDFVVGATRSLIERLPEQPPDGHAPPAREGAAEPPRLTLLGVPARTAVDEVVWVMLDHLLDHRTVKVEAVAADTLASEARAAVESSPPDLVCITAAPPAGLAHVQYLCRRLRESMPTGRILVLRPGGQAGEEEAVARLIADPAISVATTLADARTAAEQLLLLAR